VFKKVLGSILRHGATIIGGAIIGTSAESTEAIGGALIAAIGAIASLVKTIKNAKKEEQADNIIAIDRALSDSER
jgi:undecaprenyl pyrophosphate phosphatase UppP